MIDPSKIPATAEGLTQPGSMFELQDMSIDGHSYPVFKKAAPNLSAILQAGRAHGQADFLVYGETRYSFDAFFEAADALAATLQNDYNVAAGDRVAIAMRNSPEWTIAFVASILIGAIATPVNSLGKTEELSYVIEDSGAKVVICDQDRFNLVADCYEDLGCDMIVSHLDSDKAKCTDFHAAIEAGKGRAYDIANPAPESVAMQLYTSGSTGFPKGVPLRNVSMVQSIMHIMFVGTLSMALEGAAPPEKKNQDATLVTVPLFHATGLIGGLIMPLMIGQKVVMSYKWDTVEALKIIETEKITSFSTVPTVLYDLLSHPDFDDYDTSTLSRLGAGGAAAPANLPALIDEKLENPVRSAGWGMTEISGAGTIMVGGLCALAPSSAGLTSPVINLRFVDEEGKEVPAGEIGEIEVRSICCTPGYWNKPEQTAETFSEDRWMKTGDLGRRDENGFLHITGRSKETVIRGGENIYPSETEAATYKIDGVHEAVVFGVPDELMGEELAMVVYLEEDSKVDEAAIRQSLSETIAGYKVPRYIQISAEPLPQNASGKLHKLKVQEAFIAKELADA